LIDVDQNRTKLDIVLLGMVKVDPVVDR